MSIVIDENFLTDRSKRIRVDPILPVRLQKRQLLAKLGFPNNPDLFPCQVDDIQQIKYLMASFIGDPPFIIIVSEKPMKTWVTPLFVVKSKKLVYYRESDNASKKISWQKILSIISGYSRSSWIEFSNPLWGDTVVAGRLLYCSNAQQTLELQVGVEPKNLGSSKNQYFTCDLEKIRCSPQQYKESAVKLKKAGFSSFIPYNDVRLICETLRAFLKGCEELSLVSEMPTLEFAITAEGKCIIIDVDWPKQWKKVGES